MTNPFEVPGLGADAGASDAPFRRLPWPALVAVSGAMIGVEGTVAFGLPRVPEEAWPAIAATAGGLGLLASIGLLVARRFWLAAVAALSLCSTSLLPLADLVAGGPEGLATALRSLWMSFLLVQWVSPLAAAVVLAVPVPRLGSFVLAHAAKWTLVTLGLQLFVPGVILMFLLGLVEVAAARRDRYWDGLAGDTIRHAGVAAVVGLGGFLPSTLAVLVAVPFGPELLFHSETTPLWAHLLMSACSVVPSYGSLAVANRMFISAHR